MDINLSCATYYQQDCDIGTEGTTPVIIIKIIIIIINYMLLIVLITGLKFEMFQIGKLQMNRAVCAICNPQLIQQGKQVITMISFNKKQIENNSCILIKVTSSCGQTPVQRINYSNTETNAYLSGLSIQVRLKLIVIQTILLGHSSVLH